MLIRPDRKRWPEKECLRRQRNRRPPSPPAALLSLTTTGRRQHRFSTTERTGTSEPSEVFCSTTPKRLRGRGELGGRELTCPLTRPFVSATVSTRQASPTSTSATAPPAVHGRRRPSLGQLGARHPQARGSDARQLPLHLACGRQAGRCPLGQVSTNSQSKPLKLAADPYVALPRYAFLVLTIQVLFFFPVRSSCRLALGPSERTPT